jgi:phage major head subunit gpT-like protein
MTADIFKVTDTTHAAYIGTIHKGPGLFSKIGEVQAVPSYVAKVANKWTVTIADFAEGIEVSKNLFDDDIHGEWQSQVADLAIMARRTQDYNAFKLFRGAFTTTLTADGAAFIGSHNLVGGGTTNNQIVTADITGASSTALNTSAFNVAMRRLAEMKSQAGVPLQCVGDTLLVPPGIYVTARQIAVSALVPENGNNAVNVFSMDYAVKVYQSVFLGTSYDSTGSDTAWFLLDSRRHAVRRFVRQGVQTALRDWTMSNNRTYYYQANFREEVFVPDYIGVVGAKGDTT